ncbi:MAG: YfiR family protein [candidate division Zixibacteria bacterium]|nr:YfiR family protein [candidate division Zixibacteria bacterium]MDH3939080.1 YfiR family protein [candidate division Zixibacteria bacterium]MDH4034350.1 YfiR family protein [candidate division Zixibacteria bacterium]
MTLRLSIFTILLLALAATLSAVEDPIQEQMVSIISDIDNYVSWPAAKASDNGKPFFVAILGKSELATRVKELNRTKLPDGRKIRVRIVAGDLLPSNAHIVINSLTDEKQVRKYLKKLAGTSTLTISTGDIDVETILHMDVVDKGGKQEVRTTLNAKQAADEGLKIKSKLEKMAVGTDDNS